MSPRTDEFGRIERRTLTTRSISIYTKKKDFRVSARKETTFIEVHVWQTVIPKSLQVYRLGKNMGKEKSDREAHKILIISPMNEQPKVFWMSTRA